MSDLVIFVSWSGSQSKAAAEAVKEFLESVIQAAEVFVSSSDIAAGSRWNDEIIEKLRESGFGIVCLTKENLNAPWILFEAGALSQMVDSIRVSPLLIGVEPSDLKAPMSSFQATRLISHDIKKLVFSIFDKSGVRDTKRDAVGRTFDALWPEFETKILKIQDLPEEQNLDDKQNKNIEGPESLLEMRDSIENLIVENRKFRLELASIAKISSTISELNRKVELLYDSTRNILRDSHERNVNDFHFNTRKPILDRNLDVQLPIFRDEENNFTSEELRPMVRNYLDKLKYDLDEGRIGNVEYQMKLARILNEERSNE